MAEKKAKYMQIGCIFMVKGLKRKKGGNSLSKKAAYCDDRYVVELYNWSKKLVKKHDREFEENCYIG